MAKAACPWRLVARRLSAVGGGRTAEQTLDQGRGLRGHGSRPAHESSGCCTSGMNNPRRDDLRRTHPAKQSRKRRRGRVTTATSARRAARCTSPWTRSAIFSRWWSRPPTSRSVHRWMRWSSRSRKRANRSVELAYVDQGYTGKKAAKAAAAHGIAFGGRQAWPRPSAASCSCPGAGVVERSFAWLARFRRLSRDYERLPTTLAGLHWLAFACLLLNNLFRINAQS